MKTKYQNANARLTDISANFPKHLFAWLLPLLLLLSMVPSAQAQETSVSSFIARPPKIFTGANYSMLYSNTSAFVLNVRTNLAGTVDPVNVFVTGAPAGATFTLATNQITTNNNTILYSVAITNVAEGSYPVQIIASNTVSSTVISNLIINLIVGTVWIAPSAADLNWSTAANWSGGVAPGPTSNVKLEDAGVVVFSSNNIPSGTTNFPFITNVVYARTNFLDASRTIGSLMIIPNLSSSVTLSPSNNFASNVWLIGIAPFATLSVTGTNGFAVNADSANGNNKIQTVAIGGTNSTLVVSNPSANYTLNAVQTGNNGTTLLMPEVTEFRATVKRFGIADVTMAEQGGVSAQLVAATLARTNIIRALSPSTDINGVDVAASMQFFNNDAFNGTSFNNGSANTINLGISNAFFADVVRVSAGRVGAAANQIRFLPLLQTNGSNPSVWFRNTNGGRLTLFAVAFDSGSANSGNNSLGLVDTRGGTINLLADKLWLGRFRSNSFPAGASARGVMTMEKGAVDVNTVILGYQAHTNDSFCRGTLTLQGDGVFTVNDTLTLGYTTGFTNAAAVSSSFGQVSVSSNGTLRVKSILIDGPGNISANNNLTIANGGRVIVSNTIASSAKYLSTLTLNSAAATDKANLTLHVNGSFSDYYVYTTNITTTGSGTNIIEIASLVNVSYPAQIPLIKYVTGSPSITKVLLPSGFTGGLVIPGAGGAGTIDLSVSTNAPKTLVWRGTTSDWDTTTQNWLDLGTGLTTNFDNGDFVAFDDALGFQTTVTLQSSTLLPSAINMTNTALNYTFNGGGSLIGGPILSKRGTGGLAVDATTTATVQLNEGTLTGSGTIGSAIVSVGSTMNFSGTVSGGATVAGKATSSGTINGTVTIQGTGIVTNNGTISGQPSMQEGAILVNLNTMNNAGSFTVPTNSVLINDGSISGDNVSITGKFIDTSTAPDGLTLTATLTINGTGSYFPGGDSIGIVTLFNTGAGTFPGRFLMANNSTNYFKVDFGNSPTSTRQRASYVDFGNNNSLQGGGGIIMITNVGATPFAAGQSFQLFAPLFGVNILTAGTNTFPVIVPTIPGPGLIWDLSQIKTTGIVSIKAIPTTPTNFTTFNYSTTFNTTTNSTNHVTVTHLTWPTEYVGWKLQQQLNSLDNGLGTNWTFVFGAQFTNEVYVTNAFNTNIAFFRLVLLQ